MFIREKIKKNKGYKKTYVYHELVESVRTGAGPRQRLLLNLGYLPITSAQWPCLARFIDDYVKGQTSLLTDNPLIRQLGEKFALQLIRKYEDESSPVDQVEDESVRLSTLSHSRSRSVGSEYLCLSYLKKLGLFEKLRSLGLSQRQAEIACLLIIGRLVQPGSERHTHLWGREVSGLDDLLLTSFEHLSLNSLYEVSDLLVRHQSELERSLRARERSLFHLDETIVLYDLTNTYVEGQASGMQKAKYGRSKEKRSDCRLVTLGLVLDGYGFPLKSKVFAGNQSEPATLQEMIAELHHAAVKTSGSDPVGDQNITVVLDAGIATEANLAALRGSYHSICVSRQKTDVVDDEGFEPVKEDPKHKVTVKMVHRDDEVFIICHSPEREGKNRGIQSKFQQLFEETLTQIDASLSKKGGTKKVSKVWERIGRAKEKYARVAQYYLIEVAEEKGVATKVRWEYAKKEAADQRFSGRYSLRTDRTDLTASQIWQTYAMLVDLEDAFRALKDELGLRPNFHQKDTRSDGHLFITVLAYHILHSMRTNLKDKGIAYRWKTIRKRMATHTILTSRIKNHEDRTIYVRKCSDPEPFHKMIYDALGLHHLPCKPKKFKV